MKASRHSVSTNSLPRGEYLQNINNPKMNKNLVKLKPIDMKKANNDESFEGTLSSADMKALKPLSLTSTSDSSLPSSEENTPVARRGEKKLSCFSKRKIIDADQDKTPLSAQTPVQSSEKLNPLIEKLERVERFEKPEDNTFTPKVSRKKGNLYKLSIIQNASKFVPDKNQPNTTINVKAEEVRSELSKILDSTKTKEEPKTAQVSSGSSFTQAFNESAKADSTFSIKNLVFGPKVDDKILKKHLMLTMRGLNYSLKLLKPPPMSYVQSRQIMLKELKKKNVKTLLLDLDETLITSCSLRDEPDKILTPADGGPPIMIKIRPFAREFLQKMKEHFEIVIFTAAMSCYAETIIKELDPEKKLVSYILDRSFCLETKNGFYIKDLRIIKNRDLKNMVLVDNLVHSFGFQVENGVPIIPFYDNKADQELRHLIPYLKFLSTAKDLREINKQTFKLHNYSSYDEAEEVLEKIILQG